MKHIGILAYSISAIAASAVGLRLSPKATTLLPLYQAKILVSVVARFSVVSASIHLRYLLRLEDHS
jgi:hypothetical protein